MSDIKVDTDVAPPPPRCEVRMKYPIPKLEVGNSFFVPVEIDDSGARNRALQSLQSRLMTAATKHAKKVGVGTYSTRQVVEDGKWGVRIWRLT